MKIEGPLSVGGRKPLEKGRSQKMHFKVHLLVYFQTFIFI